MKMLYALFNITGSFGSFFLFFSLRFWDSLYLETIRTYRNKGDKDMNIIQQNCTLKDETSSMTTKFWGIWLPIPTVLAIINSLFWTWLILRTVGYNENPIENSVPQIIDSF